MKFEDWLKQNNGRSYIDILGDIIEFEDKAYFQTWARNQRLGEFSGNDWAMLAVSNLSNRIKLLEEKSKKDKDK